MRDLPGKRVFLRPLSQADASVLRAIDERGHHRITIDPAADNEAAIRCYQKAGFRRASDDSGVGSSGRAVSRPWTNSTPKGSA